MPLLLLSLGGIIVVCRGMDKVDEGDMRVKHCHHYCMWRDEVRARHHHHQVWREVRWVMMTQGQDAIIIVTYGGR